MKMYDEIQKYICPNTLGSYEVTKLEELSKIYTESQIIETYKNYGYKPIRYIEKVLKSYKVPSWLNKKIENQTITEEDKKEHQDFLDFIKEFRNE